MRNAYICMAFSNLWSMRDTHIENMLGAAVLYLEMQKRGRRYRD
jgi:hypothetical protein